MVRMLALLLRRAAQSAVVLAAVTVSAFGMFRYLGDPVQMMLGENATDEARMQLRRELQLDRSPHAQFAAFLARLSRGDMGRSYRSGAPVAALLAERAPATIELASCAMLLALAAGVPLGVWAAVRPRSLASRVLEIFALLGVSAPTFLTGVLLMYLFAVELEWLPAFGRGQVRSIGGWPTGLSTISGWKSLLLPTLTLAWLQMATISSA